MKFLASICSFLALCFGVEKPFEHDLHLFSIPGSNSRTLICFHGYGGSYKIAEKIKQQGVVDATLVSFNFPDYDLGERGYDPEKSTFGTIQELLPAFYVLKKYIIDKGLDSVDLYGFSGGGGAVINVLAVLNTSTYDKQLEKMGICKDEKKRIIKAIEKGIILLDAPLKSVEEILDLRGSSAEMEILAKRYRDHHFSPLDSLKSLQGLCLNIILYFQNPDEIIFNRDDALFIKRLEKANSCGKTTVLIKNEGGHLGPHLSLWKAYSEKVTSSKT